MCIVQEAEHWAARLVISMTSAVDWVTTHQCSETSGSVQCSGLGHHCGVDLVLGHLLHQMGEHKRTASTLTRSDSDTTHCYDELQSSEWVNGSAVDVKHL